MNSNLRGNWTTIPRQISVWKIYLWQIYKLLCLSPAFQCRSYWDFLTRRAEFNSITHNFIYVSISFFDFRFLFLYSIFYIRYSLFSIHQCSSTFIDIHRYSSIVTWNRVNETDQKWLLVRIPAGLPAVRSAKQRQ
jgi:hypothetical protein